MIIISVCGFPIAIVGIYEAFEHGQPIAAMVYFGFYLPIPTAVFLKKHVSYNFSVMIVLVSFFAIATYTLYIYGFSGAVIEMDITMFVLATIFFGFKRGLISIAICTVPMIIVGYLMSTEQLSPTLNIATIHTMPSSWVTSTALLIFLGVIVVMSYGILHQRLMKLFRMTIVQKKELIETNKHLEMAKNRAEENDALKTAFIRNMSHEIRTPLNGIKGFAELLCDANDTEENRDCVTMIKKSSERLISMTNNIMEIALIETKQISIKNQLISVRELCEDLVSMYSGDADEKKLEIKFVHEVDDIDNSVIYADLSKLTTVLDALVSNAIKFAHKGSVTLRYELTENSHQISVEDTGVGIKKDNLQNIFKAFEQVDGSFTRSFEGIGIGLSVAKGLTGLMNGKIKVKSEFGLGSVFTLIFPKSEYDDVNNVRLYH